GFVLGRCCLGAYGEFRWRHTQRLWFHFLLNNRSRYDRLWSAHFFNRSEFWRRFDGVGEDYDFGSELPGQFGSAVQCLLLVANLELDFQFGRLKVRLFRTRQFHVKALLLELFGEG